MELVRNRPFKLLCFQKIGFQAKVTAFINNCFYSPFRALRWHVLPSTFVSSTASMAQWYNSRFVCRRFRLCIVDKQWEAFCSSSSIRVLSLNVTTPRDSYAWNYRELATLLILSESLAKVGREPLTMGSMRKNLTTELSWQLMLYLMPWIGAW